MPGPQITLRVDDSKLNELIRKTSGKGPVRVVADGVEYGLYQEMGTHEKRGGLLGQLGFKGQERMAAHPFMKPAVEAIRAPFNRAFKDCITIEQATVVVDKAAFDVERGAKQRAPVDTGALKNSIHVVDGDEFGVTFESMRK